MNGTFADLHMAALHDRIQRLLIQLEHFSLNKGLAPIRRVNKAFNRSLHPEISDEAINQAWRRI
jgi:hypothetical protein